MDKALLYSIHPKKVIKELPTLPIRSPRSLYLTKDQVRICLKYGSVYRRFANEQRNEKVNILNIDRLHHEKFMTEEQYEKYKQDLHDGKRGFVLDEDESKKAEPEHKENLMDEKNHNEIPVSDDKTIIRPTEEFEKIEPESKEDSEEKHEVVNAPESENNEKKDEVENTNNKPSHTAKQAIKHKK